MYPQFILAHRLDKDTTGVLLIAKTEKSYEFLKAQFQNREIKKKYLALIYGQPKNDSGTIDLPIGRSRKDPRKRIAGKGATGKLREAVTDWRVLERFSPLPLVPPRRRGKTAGEFKVLSFGEDLGGVGFSLIEARPQTGRTHQIRVHFKAIGYPIVCDALYATGKVCPLPLTRQALHAASLELTLPSGTRAKLEAALPEDFETTLANLRQALA